MKSKPKFDLNFRLMERILKSLIKLPRNILPLCLAFVLVLSNNLPAQEKKTPLTIGSQAPNISVEHWVSDNDGKLEHTTKLEKDRVYVIEFWATWCGPCISAMPHMAQLQEQYLEDNVQIISISDEDLDTIDTFLERKVRNDFEERTYGELTNSYCLTTDPDKSVKKDYFYAASRTGIPCAFVIGKSGLIEWIGHPMRLAQPLRQIVDDQWDRDKFAVEYEQEQIERRKQMVLRRKTAIAMRSVDQKIRDGKSKEAVELIEEFMMDEDLARQKQPLAVKRLAIMIDNQFDGTADALREFADNNKSQAWELNRIAWTLYQRHMGDGDVSLDVLKAAKYATELAVEAQPGSGEIHDTLAHLIYVVDNDLDKAIEVQRRAVKYSQPQSGSIQTFLDQLEKEQASGKKPGKKKPNNSEF